MVSNAMRKMWDFCKVSEERISVLGYLVELIMRMRD